MTCRDEGGQVWKHTYNAENRISKIEKMDGADCANQGSATESWTYTYDGDGVRVEEEYNDGSGTLTKYYFAGGAYEVQDDGTTTTTLKYYAIAGMRVAMDDGTDLVYFASDHLSSTSIAISDTGTLLSEQRFKPFGEVRTDVGTLITETDFGYTGQRNLSGVGLMDYSARFYSPLLGRFIQPDTIIPNPGDSQAWNRYSYTSNNPVKFVDPTGHIAEGACGFQGGDCPRPKRQIYQGCSSENPEMCSVKSNGNQNDRKTGRDKSDSCLLEMLGMTCDPIVNFETIASEENMSEVQLVWGAIDASREIMTFKNLKIVIKYPNTIGGNFNIYRLELFGGWHNSHIRTLGRTVGDDLAIPLLIGGYALTIAPDIVSGILHGDPAKDIVDKTFRNTAIFAGSELAGDIVTVLSAFAGAGPASPVIGLLADNVAGNLLEQLGPGP